MGSKHLASGSTKPPLVQGKLRLYSMLYCPYAERPRLVLKLKNIPHDIININLKDKPDWYFKLHPEGKVPSLEIGPQVTIESLDISDYLDEKYPSPPLYPADKDAKERDKEYLKNFGKYTSFLFQVTMKKEKSLAEYVEEARPLLQELEAELASRGGTYFGGKTPQMIDYMVWPWAERVAAIPLTFGEPIPIKDGEFPRIRAWYNGMRSQKVVQEVELPPEKHFKLRQLYTEGGSVDYDSI